MKISKDTKVCISLAKTAGNFGTTIYNHVFEKLGIDFIYKSFSTQDLEAAVLGAKAIGICGISVTMPYKTEVLKLVDELTEEVKETGAANTIVNSNGRLVAYNTDTDSTRIVLEEAKDKSVLYILGRGGFSKAVQYSSKGIFEEYKLVTRENWSDIHNINSGTVFNCTPVKNLSEIFNTGNVDFIDCDVSTASGKRLAVLQAARQFNLYTGQEFLTDYVLSNLDRILERN